MHEARVVKDSAQKTITSCGGVLFFANAWVAVPEGLESEARANPFLDVRETKKVVADVAISESKSPPEKGEIEEEQTDESGYSASPGAVKLAEDLGIDLSLVGGSGVGGNIIKNDVQDYADQLYEEEA